MVLLEKNRFRYAIINYISRYTNLTVQFCKSYKNYVISRSDDLT